METPEIILLAGAPGSGKSSIARRFVELGKPEGARHLSIGDLKRSITSGETVSIWAEMLQQKEHPDRKTGAAPSIAMIGIMEEFILLQPERLTIVDGFPRYLDRVQPFTESMQHIGADVLALCVVEADENILCERIRQRAPRKHQVLEGAEFIEERLADHRNNIVPTLELLAQYYPHYSLDGAQSLDTNAAILYEIYNRHSPQPQ